MKLITLNKDPNILIKDELDFFLNPDYIYIPIKNNKLLVKQNQKIAKGDYIFKDNYSITSSVSGIVYGLLNCYVNEREEKCVVIKNDFREKKRKIPHKSLEKITIDSLLHALEDSHQKKLLNLFKSIKRIDNLIISVIDDEPYLKNSIMLMKENINEILSLTDELGILYNAKHITLVIKEKESKIIEECLNTIGTYPNINLTLVDDLYLLSRKMFLLNHLNYEINNTLCLTVKELLALYNIIYNHELSTEKLITICGPDIKGRVFKVKKYANLTELVSKKIKYKKSSVFIINGLMSGYEAKGDYIIITDEVEQLNIMPIGKVKVSNCFNCGKCQNICPVKIDPLNCYLHKKGDKRCLNCGLCNYVCPAYIDLKREVLGDKK